MLDGIEVIILIFENMVEAVFVFVFCIGLFVFGFFLGVLTRDKAYVKYYNLYVEEKRALGELMSKLHEKISFAEYIDYAQWYIEHLREINEKLNK